MILPPLPLDDSSLDLYMKALQPGPEAERSSIGDVLDLLAEMAGSDPTAVEEQLSDDTVVMRDPTYHPNELIVALIKEVRRLRARRVPSSTAPCQVCESVPCGCIQPPNGGRADDPANWAEEVAQRDPAGASDVSSDEVGLDPDLVAKARAIEGVDDWHRTSDEGTP